MFYWNQPLRSSIAVLRSRLRRWPSGSRFHFIFSPNNSGTTIMSQFLASQVDGYLPPFGNWEGQMIPSLAKIMRTRPWDSGERFDWPFIRNEWESLLRKSGKSIFVEASPPNMLRVPEIREMFSGQHLAVFSMSCPYRQIASCLRNYSRPPMSPAQMEEQTAQWIFKARVQRENVMRYPEIPRTSYEEFCKAPRRLLECFGVEADQLRPNAYPGKSSSGKVTDVVDMTARNIAFLHAEEWQAVSAKLAGERPLLEFFGYRILSLEDRQARMDEEPHLARKGRADREKWETRAR